MSKPLMYSMYSEIIFVSLKSHRNNSPKETSPKLLVGMIVAYVCDLLGGGTPAGLEGGEGAFARAMEVLNLDILVSLEDKGEH